jgi:hypothetical protein
MEAIKEGAQSSYNAVSSALSSASDSVKDAVNGFSSQVEGSTEFVQSNSILAKFAFLILALIVFFLLINLGIMLMNYFIKPPSSPFLVSGTANASSGIQITQDPKDQSAKTVQRSNNQTTGIEFTYSIWIYINDLDPKAKPPYQNIFNKGNAAYDLSGIATVNNAPGLYLDQTKNQLLVVMNTVSSAHPQQTVEVPNIPLRKWFHVALRMENKYLDVYVNGTVTTRMVMLDVPKQNFFNVMVCQNGGFNGNYADLRYFDRALSVFEINNIVVWGRNTSAASGGSNSDATGFPYYLSNLWYSHNY